MIYCIRRFRKPVSFFLLTAMFLQLGIPVSYALTSGPSQPETQQFAPAGADNMVDPFTGDFSYNIPLMDVGGYPINLNYAGGITPDAEASWTGLGWNLNVGAINRNVRGLPDDFAGDEVIKEYNIKPNQTVGLNGYIQPELWGIEALKLFNIKLNGSLFYNNYNGFGMSVGMNPSLSSSLGSKSGLTANLGLNLSVGSEDGVGITPSLGLKQKGTKGDVENTLSGSISFPFSSREGLKGMSLSASYSNSEQKKNSAGNVSEANSQSLGGSAFLGFATPSYTPFIQNNTYSINASGDLGVAFLSNSLFEPDFGVSVFYNGQFLNETTRKTNAFGYLHAGLASACPEETRLMDFNREKEGGGFNKHTIGMPLANHTYDIFQVSGQGVGGTYRAYRGDVGTISDMSVRDFSVSPEAGVELSIGAAPQPTTKFGIHLKCNVSQSYSGTWQNGGNPVKFGVEQEKNTLKEQVYFRKIGEMAAETDNDFLTKGQLGYNLVNNQLHDVAGGWLTNSFYVNNNKSALQPLLKRSRTERQAMNTRFTPLTAKEVNYPIYNYETNTTLNTDAVKNNTAAVGVSQRKLNYKCTELPRTDNSKKSHHLSEMRVTDNSGARYVYGIPVYNNFQEEATFALNNKGKSKQELDTYRKAGLAPYSQADVNTGNKNGLDHYFSKTTTPSHASSYLLTQILSSDYVDSDNIKGPSDGDLGNYTKFNYSRTSSDFKWRTPFDQNKCSFSDGMYGSPNDDKGSYVYGEKEIWYLHSIETRTHVAEFYLEDREDGLGVAGREGGPDLSAGRRLKKLSKISLYSKHDKLNGKNEPVKTVYFSYDYSLCPNTPNSIAAGTKGKLTLKKVWFTYGYSQKGLLNPYVFKYAENFTGQANAELNPAYGIKNYDKWGNYKPENTNQAGNEVFPYVEQDKTKADVNVAVYMLSSIKTPTGGTIRVYHESDDYAYVQDKRAMEMFHIRGVSKNDITNITGNSTANYGKLYDGSQSSDYLIVNLNKEFIPSATSTDQTKIYEEFRKLYLNSATGEQQMYFKAKIKVFNEGSGREEFIPGYARILNEQSHPVLENGKYTCAIIKLASVNANAKGNGRTVNPIIRTALAYTRMNLNRESFGSGNAEDDGIEQVLGSMLSIMQSVVSFITGYTDYMMKKNSCSEFDPQYSYVRLYNAEKMKLGGGHRVKAVVMLDNWDMMKSKREKNLGNSPVKEAAYYGQYYDYTKQEATGVIGADGKAITRTISSGVAAYEPQLGGDENPFRQPLFVTENALLVPSKEYFLEEPFGESFFPGPSVGYSKVRTIPMKMTETDLQTRNFIGNGSGYVEQQFYTAQDFPTIVKKSDMTTPRQVSPLKINFIVSLSNEKVSTTQGYYIECNDMHGKEKSKKVMPDPKTVSGKLIDAEPISYVEYMYKTDANGKLSNSVPYVSKDLSLNSAGAELGIEVDMTMDERFSSNTIKGGGAEINPKGTLPALPLPVVLFGFTIIPSWVDNYSEFKSIVTTKVINRHGILDKTVAKDNGQTITTQNLAWDKETGQVLLTRVENEFHDQIWNFTYPGHWAYKMMGLAYKNEGVVVDNLSKTVDGSIFPAQDGDEWMVKTASIFEPVYVNKTGSGFELRTKDGSLLPTTTSITFAKLYRSGYRNIAQTPVGSIAMLDDPITAGGGASLDFTKVRIVNAGANQFKSDWKVFCNCGVNSTNLNPYTEGKKGNIRPWKSWTYLTNRQLNRVNDQVNIRKDGYFNDFKVFWNYSTNTGLLDTLEVADKTKTQWQYVTQIQNYNPVGMEIENKDALGRFSMAQFGYGRNLPVGTSNNSRYQETGFDGFEDYDYGDCKDDHFSWRGQSSNLSEKEAHTGRKSIKVQGAKSLLINKIINPCTNPGTGNNQ